MTHTNVNLNNQNKNEKGEVVKMTNVLTKVLAVATEVRVELEGVVVPMDLEVLRSNPEVLETIGGKLDRITKDGEVTVIKMTNSELVIDKGVVFKNVVDRIQKKDKGYSHVQIQLDSIKEYDDHGRVVKETPTNYVTYISLPENLAVRKNVFTMEQTAVLRSGKYSKRISISDNSPATFDILSIVYADSEMQGEKVLTNGVFKFTDSYGDYKFFIRYGAAIVNAEDNKNRMNVAAIYDANGELKAGWELYKPWGASPSNERQKVMYFIKFGSEEQEKRAHKILSELTYGYYDMSILNEETSYAKLCKFYSRCFQWMAPSSALGNLKGYAVYFGKFNEDRMDGMAFVSAEALSRMIKEKHDLNVDVKVLLGAFMQTRLTLSKVGSMPIKSRLIELAISYLDANPIHFDNEYIKAHGIELKNRAESGEFNGRVVIFGECAEALYDTNGMKAMYDFSKAINPEFTLLRILKSNGSKLSKNITGKMMAKDKTKGADIAYNMMSEETFKKVNDLFISPKAKIISPAEYGKDSLFMDSILTNNFVGYIRQDRNLSLNIIDNVTKGFNKMMDRFSAPMEGKNAGITVGIEVLFGFNSIIGDHEVFMPAANKMFKMKNIIEAMWKIFAVKYPTMDINEYSVLQGKALAFIKKAIKSLPVSEELKGLFVEYYSTLHDSVAVVPACELYKKKHAGSDFDTDQISWSIDEELTALMEQSYENKEAVVILD